MQVIIKEIYINIYTIQLNGWDILKILDNYYQSNFLETIEPSILVGHGPTNTPV